VIFDHFTPGDRNPNIHYTGDFVVSTAGLVAVENSRNSLYY
jgi:hypothetical protein